MTLWTKGNSGVSTLDEVRSDKDRIKAFGEDIDSTWHEILSY